MDICYFVLKNWYFPCPCMITRCARQYHMDRKCECDLECIPVQCSEVLKTAFIFVPSFRSAPSICLCSFLKLSQLCITKEAGSRCKVFPAYLLLHPVSFSHRELNDLCFHCMTTSPVLFTMCSPCKICYFL